jgi:hypothetical protein
MFSFVRKVVHGKIRRGEAVKLVIGVREPVSRNISGYFQSLNRREMDRDADSHILKFFCFCPHLAPLYWIDNEIERNFGVDVYAYDFDKELGFSRFNSKGFEVFLYKLESLSSLEGELADFLDEDGFKLLRDNVAEDSDFSALYSEFKNTIKFDRAYLDCLYNSKMVDKFYLDSEVDKFYEAWEKKSS